MSDVQLRAGDTHVGLWRTGDPIVVSGGYGGFQSLARPVKTALTPWTGRDPFQMVMPLLLFAGGDSIEPDRRNIETLASGAPPAPVTVTGGALPIPAGASGQWVINDIDWSGDEVRRASDASLTRKLVTVTLLEFVGDTLLDLSTYASRTDAKQVIRHYRVKKGDTLSSIASRTLGKSSRWVDISALNNVRSSGALKVGQLLVLPPR